MSIEEEYETCIARLKETNEGGRLFLCLSEISKVLYSYLSEAAKQYPMVQTCLSMMGEKEVLLLLEKNFVLILGRVLQVARTFDALDPARKVEKVIDLLGVLKEEQEEWLKEYKKKTEHIHDKAERRKRRKEPVGNETACADKLLCEASIKVLFEKLLPEGTGSFFLPSMAKLFLSKNFFESCVTKNIDSLMKAVHEKVWKESLLFLLITFLFKDVFLKNTTQQVGERTLQLTEQYEDKGKQITAWLLELLSIADPRIKFLVKEDVTQKAVAIIGKALFSFSVERWLLSIVHNGLLGKTLIGDLDLLVDRVSGDPKAITFLLKRIVALSSPAEKLSPQVSMGEILILGVKAAAIEAAIADKAASLVYQEIPLKIFQHIRLFVLSSFFERFIYRSAPHIIL